MQVAFGRVRRKTVPTGVDGFERDDRHGWETVPTGETGNTEETGNTRVEKKRRGPKTAPFVLSKRGPARLQTSPTIV